MSPLTLHPILTRLSATCLLWWRVLRCSYLRWSFHNGPIMASAIAFYAMLCLAPLGILLVALIQVVAGPGTDAYMWLKSLLHELDVSAASQAMGYVDSIISSPGPHMANIVSVIMLIWAGMRLFEVIERSLTEIWPGRVIRDYFRRKVISFVMLTACVTLLGSIFLIDGLLASVQPWLRNMTTVDPVEVAHFRPRILVAVEFVNTLFAFWLMYKTLPVQPVSMRAAMSGGLCASIIWHLSSIIFTYAFNHTNQYNLLYGSLGGVVIFAMWMLLWAQILLYGAHFAAAYQHVFDNHNLPDTDHEFISPPVMQRDWLRALRSLEQGLHHDPKTK